VRDLVLAAERKAEERKVKRHELIEKSGSSIALEADLWAARLFARQAVVAMENRDAGRSRKHLQKAARAIKELDEELLDAIELRNLFRILETEYSIATWQLARFQRDPEGGPGTDSIFAAHAHDVVSKARELLDDPLAIYMPFTPWLQESSLQALVDLGWTDLATLELDRWMKRAPAFRTEQYKLRQKITTAKPSEWVMRWSVLRSGD
jgi:hypothetical protein